MDLPNYEILQSFPHILRKNIEELWTGGQIGLSCLNVRINVNNQKFSSCGDASNGNRFILDVPYAGRHLFWEIIFNDDDLTFAPDFDFLNDQFLIDPDVDLIKRDIPALAEWSIQNPKSLVTVVRQFLSLYKNYQLDKLQEPKCHTYYTEYTLLTGEMGISPDCIEVFIDQNDSVHYLIRIVVDFSNLPPYIQPSSEDDDNVINPCQDAATLKVCFSNGRVAVQLQLSPRLECIIGSSKHFHIPSYNKDCGLIEYVPAVTKLITEKLEQITQAYNLRNQYISALLAYQGKSVIEYDSTMFHEITLLLEFDNTSALTLITLTKKFPQEKPTVQLNSICREQNGCAICEKFSSYPYDPRWHPEILARNLLSFLLNTMSEKGSNTKIEGNPDV